MGNAFVKIGTTQIKKSNIKSFGTAIESIPRPPPDALGLALMKMAFSLIVKDPKQASGRKFLYVTTYQDDNYKFYDDEIDIDATLKILEEI